MRHPRHGLLARALGAAALGALALGWPATDAVAAVKYWIGPAGGSFASNSNWSTSSGGQNNTNAPGSSDIARFDAGGPNSCSISSNVNVAGIDIQTAYPGTLTQNTGSTVTVGASNFVQAGGAFLGGNSTLDINGTFQLSGGVFTSTSGTLSIGGAFTSSVTLFQQTGGTFNPNGGTLLFDPYDGGCSSLTFTLDGPGTLTFHHVSLFIFYLGFCGLDKLTVASGDSVIAQGDFTHLWGEFHGAWEAWGDVAIALLPYASSASLSFGGNADQTYLDLGSIPTGAYSMNKTGGTLTLFTDLNLSTTGQDLAVSSGTLDLSGYDLTVNDALSVGGTLLHGSGLVTFGSLSIASTGTYSNGSTGDLTVGAGGVSNSGSIDLNGGGSGCSSNSIQIRSSQTGSQRAWTGGGFFSLVDVDVKDQGGTAAITVYSGNSSGNNGSNWSFNTSCTEWSVWGGGSNQPPTGAWNVAANWSGDELPDASSLVRFDGTSTTDCLINVATNVATFAVLAGYSGTLAQGAGQAVTVGSGGYAQAGGSFAAGNSAFTVNGIFTLSGGTFTAGSGTARVTGTVSVTGGTLSTGTTGGIFQADSSITIAPGGTFDMPGSGTLALADASVFEAQYDAASPSLFRATSASATVTKTAGGTGGFTFRISGKADIAALSFSYGGAAGLEIGNGTNPPTLSRLESVTFANIHSNPSACHLTIRVPSLNFSSPGVYFGAVSSGQCNVHLEDTNGGGDTAMFLEYRDAATNGAGAGATYEQEIGGSNVTWLYSVSSDTGGSIQGLPTAAFDWNTYAQYSTYVAYRDVSGPGTTDRIYVRDANGDPKYHYDIAPADGDVVGTPIWNTEAAGHVLYAVTSQGKILKLLDDGASLAPLSSGAWSTPFTHANVAQITSPLVYDWTNLYFGGTDALGAALIFGVELSSKNLVKLVGPLPSIVTTGPSWRDVSGTIHLYAGTDASSPCPGASAAHLYDVDTTGLGTIYGDNASTAKHGLNAPTSLVSARLYAGDDGGRVHGVDTVQANLPALGAGWPYRDTLTHTAADLDNCLFPITASPWVTYGSWRVSVGDADGHFYVLNSSGQSYNGVYPIHPTTDAFANSAISLFGVIVAGTAGGQVFYLDESTGNLIQTYSFGAGAVISPITYQSSAQKFMLGTSTGGLYWLPKVADPTP